MHDSCNEYILSNIFKLKKLNLSNYYILSIVDLFIQNIQKIKLKLKKELPHTEDSLNFRNAVRESQASLHNSWVLL